MILARLVHALLGAVPGRLVAGSRTLPRGASTIESVVAFVARPLEGRVLPVRTGPAAGMLLRGERRSVAWLTGKVEPEVQLALTRLLRPGDTFVDVGAATGFFSVLAGRLVGPQGAVVAFEPHPERAAAIRANARLNGLEHVTVVEAAVSDAEGEAFLADPAEATASLGGVRTPGSLAVATTTLDGFLEQRPELVPALVKIDVEGHERAVLGGLERTLRERRPLLVVELHGDADVAGALEDAGYTWTLLEEAASLEAARHGGHLLARPRDEPSP